LGERVQRAPIVGVHDSPSLEVRDDLFDDVADFVDLFVELFPNPAGSGEGVV